MPRTRSAIPPRPKPYRTSQGYRADIRWTRPDGSVVRRTFSAPLSRIVEERMDDWRQSMAIWRPGAEATVADVARDYLAAQERKGVRPATLKADVWTLSHILPAIGERAIGELRADDVTAMLAGLDGLAPSGRHRIRRVTRTLLQRGVRMGVLDVNVADQVDVPRRERHIVDLPPLDAVQSALDGARERGDTLWPLLWTLAGTGLRLGEARGLRREDVDLARGTLRVIGQADPHGAWAPVKTRSARRTLPIGPRLRVALDAVDGSSDGPYLFGRPDGRPAAESSIREAWRVAQLVAWGRQRMRVHDLRHLYASVLLSRGVPLPDVARVMGHASPVVTASMYAWALTDSHDRVTEALVDSGLG